MLWQFHLLILKFKFWEETTFTKLLSGFSLSLPKRDRPFHAGEATTAFHG